MYIKKISVLLRRAGARQRQGQRRHQRNYRTRFGFTSVRGHDGRSRVYGDIGHSQQSWLRNAIPVRVSVGRLLAILVAFGERVQRLPVNRLVTISYPRSSPPIEVAYGKRLLDSESNRF